MTQAFGHLERLCLEDHSDCQGHSFDTQNDSTLTDQWLNLIVTIRAGQLSATTNMKNSQGDYVQFPLTIGLVQGYLQNKLGGAKYSGVLETIQNLREGKEQQITDILDYYCRLQIEVAGEPTTIRTWYTYGVCVGPASVAATAAFGWFPQERISGFMAEPAVLAQDYFGRFAVAQGMEAYRDFKPSWNDAMATGPFVGMFSVLSSWKAEAVPVQPGFRAGIQAVALGNLYDPNTPFIWSNQMRESLPDGVLIIWQGGGHDEQHDAHMKDCTDAIDLFWQTGKLPPDGLTCRTSKFR